MYTYSNKSKKKMEGLHSDLVAILNEAIEITKVDFSVFEGMRSVSRQRKLVALGKSQTMNSRHLTGHAVDLVPHPYGGDNDGDGEINGHDWDEYFPIADAMILSAKKLDIPLRWGGNWKVTDVRGYRGDAKKLHSLYKGSFPDGPHFELPRRHYGG